MTRTAAAPAQAGLPQNEDAERSVLGSILVENSNLAAAEESLTPADFYRPAHQRIFAAMQEMHRASAPIDVLTLAERLQGDTAVDGLGGVAYLSRLMDGIPRLTNVAHYAAIVRERSLRRSLMRIAAELSTGAATGDDDVEALALSVEQRLRDVLRGTRRGTGRDFTDVMIEVLDGIEERIGKGTDVAGVPTGLSDVDDLTDGLQSGELIVLAARTSMGKSSLAMGIAEHAARHGRAVKVFSLEMSDRQLVQRVVLGGAGLDQQRVRRGLIDERGRMRLQDSAMSRRGLRIDLDEATNITMPQIFARCRRAKAEKGLGLVVVDYLQLISPSGTSRGDNRAQEVGLISTGLKALARELDVPVLALSQLSRASKDKRGERPHLNDLRDSGRIEEDADVVMLIHREEVALRREGKPVPEDKREMAELIVAKNRNGPTDTIRLRFRANLMRFESMARHGQEEQHAGQQRFDARAAAAGERNEPDDDRQDTVPF